MKQSFLVCVYLNIIEFCLNLTKGIIMIYRIVLVTTIADPPLNTILSSETSSIEARTFNSLLCR